LTLGGIEFWRTDNKSARRDSAARLRTSLLRFAPILNTRREHDFLIEFLTLVLRHFRFADTIVIGANGAGWRSPGPFALFLLRFAPICSDLNDQIGASFL
jgi:hypothetical protein